MYPVQNSKVPAYDKAATMFSPDGRLYQVEYASKIVEQGTTGVGLICADGVILAADKSIQSRLVIPESIEKIFKIDENIAVVSAGLVGDARRLVGIARRQAQDNRVVYSEKIQVETMAKEIAETKQAFTQYGGLRPFGVAFIIGGLDEKGPKIFETEPSGALAEYKAIAIGRNREKAMELFEKEYKENLSVPEAINLAYRAIEKSMPEKEKISVARIEFAVVDKNGFRHLSDKELKAAFK
ncbi:MAG: archaeal proteasome endopeptidase complex subunit alpha [Candidatus Diapherotrites archaeon]|nr:archaeal proteasome endopeptidase complex subunit alpha [Candidatus Diapherotrites archaeon]